MLKEGDLFQRSVIQQFGANGEKNNPDLVIITIIKLRNRFREAKKAQQGDTVISA